MVKFFGVIFLGRPREEKLAQAHDAGGLERLGLAWLTAGCVLLGLFPVAVIEVIDPVTYALVGRGLAQSGRVGRLAAARAGVRRARLLQPDPLPARDARASCSSPSSSCAASTTGGCAARRPGTAASRMQTARMQDTAEGFGQPIRQIFEPFYRMRRELPIALRRRAALQGHGRGPAVGVGVPAHRRGHGIGLALGRPPAARAHLDLPALQLPHPRDPALPHPGMNLEGILAQLPRWPSRSSLRAAARRAG